MRPTRPGLVLTTFLLCVLALASVLVFGPLGLEMELENGSTFGMASEAFMLVFFQPRFSMVFAPSMSVPAMPGSTPEDNVMKVVITGGGGFVGRRLARGLAEGLSNIPVDRIVVLDQTLPDGLPDGVVGVEGDLSDPAVVARAVQDGCDMLFHLATVPGGAAEADPKLSRAINIDATLDLFEAAAAAGRARVVFSSSIAVLGDPLPSLVDDGTPFRPTLTYGAHKLMAEYALADMTRRGALAGVTVRLPGILARPSAPSGMKSAFMSDLFHALAAGRPFVCPVGPEATIWAMSVDRCVDNLLHAATVDPAALDGQGATLPALRPTMAELIQAVALETKSDPGLVTYQPDAALQAQFGALPPLRTQCADAAGFRHDGDLGALVRRALHAAGLSREIEV